MKLLIKLGIILIVIVSVPIFLNIFAELGVVNEIITPIRSLTEQIIHPIPESKFRDCSIYKEEYGRATSDNLDNMIGEALSGVAKTRECEKYNEEIKKQYGILGIDTSKVVCPEGDGYSICELNKKYPTGGAAIRAAVDSGVLDYNKLPKEYQKMYNDTLAPYIVGHNQKSDEMKPTDTEKEIAQTQEDHARMMLKRCHDITQKDLSGCDLRGFTLHDKDLSYVNLLGANLFAVDLSRTNFTGANLDGAYLARANISDAIFTGCTGIPTGEPIGATLPICTPIP